MNQAREIKTKEIIDAESLKHLFEEGLSEYECIDESCKIKLTPCSFKPTNKNRPYFKSLKGSSHSKTCKFSEYLRMLEKAKNRALTEFELEDMPFPSKFEKVKKRVDENIIYESTENDAELENTGRIRTKASGEFIETLNKSKIVASISPIVDFYLKCPYNRDVELEIENKRMMYMYWFKRIEKPISKANYKGKCIYFGKLHTDKTKIIDTKDTLEITLFECESWEKGNKNGSSKQINPFKIVIDKNVISKNKLSRIRNEINYTIEEKIEAFKNREEHKKKHAYVFFLGDAPSNDKPYSFKTIDGTLVARYTQIYPTGSKRTSI